MYLATFSSGLGSGSIVPVHFSTEREKKFIKEFHDMYQIKQLRGQSDIKTTFIEFDIIIIII